MNAYLALRFSLYEVRGLSRGVDALIPVATRLIGTVVVGTEGVAGSSTLRYWIPRKGWVVTSLAYNFMQKNQFMHRHFTINSKLGS